MSAIKVSDNVRKQLYTGERVIGKVSGGTYWDMVDYYATDRRILRCERSGWWLFWLGILGFLKKKDLTHSLDYPRLLGTEFVSHHPPLQVAIGLIVGLIMLVPGALLLIMQWGAEWAYFGWFLVFFGGLYIVMLCGIKQTYCQFKVTNIGESELSKWRIYLPKIGGLPKKIRQFARLVDEILNSSKPAQAPAFVPPVPAAAPVGPTAIPITASKPPEIPAVPTTARKEEPPVVAPAAPPTVVMPPAFARIVLPDNSEIQITGKTRSLGRNDFLNLVSPEVFKFISREHIVIRREDGKYHITDAGSSNGTKVNGVLLQTGERYELKDGDCIILGEMLTLIFRTGDAPLQARPPVPQETPPDMKKEGA